MNATKRVRLESGASITKFVQAVIAESMKSNLEQKAIQEKENQQATADSLFGDAGGGESVTSKESNEPKATGPTAGEQDNSDIKSGEITVNDVIDKLNIIRSGQSFKDDKVNAALTKYVDNLSKDEKTALLSFLKGIVQVTQGEVPAHAAIDPGKDPANIKMHKTDKEKSKHVKPNVIKVNDKSSKQKHSEENTAPPAPIKAVKK
jgi:hypothetical protein